jgi:hypothetical protein
LTPPGINALACLNKSADVFLSIVVSPPCLLSVIMEKCIRKKLALSKSSSEIHNLLVYV